MSVKKIHYWNHIFLPLNVKYKAKSINELSIEHNLYTTINETTVQQQDRYLSLFSSISNEATSDDLIMMMVVMMDVNKKFFMILY